MTKLCNAFSLQMLGSFPVTLEVTEVPQPTKEELQKMDSAIGHQDTANVLGVQCVRKNIKLNKGEDVIVAQLTGGRLPEGSTTLPEGFNFKWLKVEVK